jgi:hypothetical protein
MRPSLPSSAKTILICCFTILAISSAFAQVNGAIFTTIADGTTVNGNIYDAKTDVYLNGGPQNQNSAGLSPDGLYYFQVTDPSGVTLLSTDDIGCRTLQVTNGVVAGPVPGVDHSNNPCEHAAGANNPANGSTTVQLSPYNDTPNPGGEYKVWIIPVNNYDPVNCAGNFGFCHASSKTDNFKIKAANAAYVTVCKFNDQDGDGIQDTTNNIFDPFIAGWPVTATGVDDGQGNSGSVTADTDQNGCVSFAVTHFPASVTLTEDPKTSEGWTQTAPQDGSCTLGGTSSDPSACSVSGGVITLTLAVGDNATAPNFGNTQCTANCAGGPPPVVGKTAAGGYDDTFKWDIAKDVDKTTVDSASGSATFNYTVNVTHDGGTVSNVKVQGKIMMTNNDAFDITNATVTDLLSNNTACTVANGTSVTIPAGKEVDLNYTCDLSALPQSALTNTAELEWFDVDGTDHTIFTDPVSVSFTANLINGSVDVTDTFGGTLGTVKSTDPSPTSFNYSHTFTAPSGTCTKYDNTATFTATDDSTVTGSASKQVTVCVGADLTVSKTATASYDSNITKDVDKTRIETSGSSATFNYTVKVTTSNWKVSGTITVTNPNDWEAISVNLADVLTDVGGSCTITGGSTQSVPASSSITPTYTCSFAKVPSSSSGTNKATGTWDAAASFTPDGSTYGTHAYAFSSLTVTDCFSKKGVTCTPNTLGTVTIPPGLATFTYSRTVTNASGGTCQEYDNTATITETNQSASKQVNVCNTKTGALTMGFWQNKNGQGIITGGASTAGVCNSGTWLRQYAPFQDLSATATCAQVATYVYNIIKAANASGASMNAMLKAQMLATALDVYFSNSALGGNKIGAAQPLGGVKIDLTQVCNMLDNSSTGSGTCSGSYSNASSAFGGATSLTVSQILAYAASQSNAGGSIWYGNVKSVQQLAKNTFDAINNQAAIIAP